MSAARFISENVNKMSPKTQFERLYVERVLARVPGLNWEALEAQTRFVDPDGSQRFIDFTIVEGDAVKIAIEVDGFDKTGSGSGMTREEFDAFSRREQDIAALGYRVIRVANRLIMTEPDRCARTVELVLKRERALAARLAAGPSTLDRDVVRQQMLNAAERHELQELRTAHADAFRTVMTQLEQEVARREATEAAHDADRRRTTKIGRYFVAVTVAVAVASAILTITLSRDVREGAAASGSARTVCSTAASWQRARTFVGRAATLIGPVVGARYQHRTQGQPTFIDVGEPHPATNRLAVVVWGDDRAAFPVVPEELYAGESIAVTGTVSTYRGVSQIEISTPDAIAVC